MMIVIASVAALFIFWLVWVIFQMARWRHIADDLIVETFEELKTFDFDSLVARVGQPPRRGLLLGFCCTPAENIQPAAQKIARALGG